ncbi:MAG: aminoacyl-tRNA hydrolase [Oscillospiraceae bacterium]|nr:aminoacyl-tRNA hydrolase [Oscillospiraceae bacterium]
MLKFFQKSGSVKYIVVFLGNPGAKYDGTRHNVGFMTGDKCEKDTGASITRVRFKALCGECTVNGEKVLLMKPQTFMNLSGEAVREAAKFYKVESENIIVISDDITLDVGKLRIRTKGSAGGHNGLKNIIACIGTDNFPRIKIGVGKPPHPDYDIIDWVLGSFKNQDAVDIDKSCARAWEAVKTYITEGADKAMNKFNG